MFLCILHWKTLVIGQCAAKSRPRATQEQLKSSQEPPKSSQERPKSGPRATIRVGKLIFVSLLTTLSVATLTLDTLSLTT